MENLKVKILKKSKEAPYPEHIIVERKSTHELVHLYFDDGLFKKLTHIKRDPQIRMAWDKKEKKYKALPPNYLVLQEVVREKNKGDDYPKYHYLKGPENQNFFSFSVMPPWNMSSILFTSDPKSLFSSSFFIKMDLNDRCIPNHYVGPLSTAEIKEIYPRQKGKVCPRLQNLKENERS